MDSSLRRVRPALRRAGAAVLDGEQTDRLLGHAFDPADGHLRRSVLGRPAHEVAVAAGVELEDPVRVLVLPLPLGQVEGPYGREKLAPLVSLFTVEGVEQGLSVCQRLLTNHGSGHTAVIHTNDQRLQQRFAEEIPASRILVNAPPPTAAGHRQRPGTVVDPGLWHLWRQLHHRQRHLHQPAQHQAAGAALPWGSRHRRFKQHRPGRTTVLTHLGPRRC